MRPAIRIPTMPILFCTLLAALLSACSSLEVLKHPPQTTPSYALEHPENTELGGRFAAAAAAHAGKSGFMLLDQGEESLLWRGELVGRAQHTIDIQTFIWYGDNVGTIAAERVLEAADRGVRVRVLVDDIPLAVKQEYLARLNAHPNLEIRIYNPLADPGASLLTKLAALFGNWSLKHRRMHNKLFVVDNSVAVAGGRNIADEYYDMNTEFNFRDRDLLAVGQVVPELSSSFDRFWNSPWSVPVSALTRQQPTEEEIQAYYAQLAEYAKDPKNFPPRFYDNLAATGRKLESLDKELIWADAQVLVDIPGKNRDLENMEGFSATGKALTEAAAAAEHEIIAETPYLIPMEGTLELFHKLHARGVKLRFLTNSYGSTDSPPAFAGYMRWRPRLLQAGVELHEMRPDPAIEPQLIKRYPLMPQDALVALHAKTAVFDRKRVFVGSFNLDPRSTHLNTELGLLVESEELARQIAAVIERDMRPENSWEVTLAPNGSLQWRGIRNGRPVRLEYEPDTGFWDLFKMLPISLLPLEHIL